LDRFNSGKKKDGDADEGAMLGGMEEYYLRNMAELLKNLPEFEEHRKESGDKVREGADTG